MNHLSDLRFLRPYLHNDLSAVRTSAYRSFRTSLPRTSNFGSKSEAVSKQNKLSKKHGATSSSSGRHFTKERIKELQDANALLWPRIKKNPITVNPKNFTTKYTDISIGKTHKDLVNVRGKLRSIRVAGKGLAFMDLVRDGQQVQVVCNATTLGAFADTKTKDFKTFFRLLNKGDYLSVDGNPYRTTSGELSVLCSQLPEVLSPSLAELPRVLEDPETRIRNRHVDLLVNPEVSQTLRLRSHIIQYLRNFLLNDKFLEVQTPLIVDKASGAVAKPFVTTATEFPEKELALRIAPEIWLKRLIIGGMERVFEIGPAFRNEGLDATHNPEFTTCEFYKSYAELEELIKMTEHLFFGLVKTCNSLPEEERTTIPEIDEQSYAGPFKRITFIPAIEEGLGMKLPNLESPEAEKDIIDLFNLKELPLPSSPTLPRLLDKLAALYIEPQCISPTFIIHHPSLMSPLAKSFVCPETNQIVSARAELFINKREIANMYEEENSPISQREKFTQQQRWKDDENEGIVDESYIEALEWGLPPTGGWGCGVDRIVMLFSGAKRISDVLAFGSLKNVVNLGNRGSDETTIGGINPRKNLYQPDSELHKTTRATWKRAEEKREELLRSSFAAR